MQSSSVGTNSCCVRSQYCEWVQAYSINVCLSPITNISSEVKTAASNAFWVSKVPKIPGIVDLTGDSGDRLDALDVHVLVFF